MSGETSDSPALQTQDRPFSCFPLRGTNPSCVFLPKPILHPVADLSCSIWQSAPPPLYFKGSAFTLLGRWGQNAWAELDGVWKGVDLKVTKSAVRLEELSAVGKLPAEGTASKGRLRCQPLLGDLILALLLSCMLRSDCASVQVQTSFSTDFTVSWNNLMTFSCLKGVFPWPLRQVICWSSNYSRSSFPEVKMLLLLCWSPDCESPCQEKEAFIAFLGWRNIFG